MFGCVVVCKKERMQCVTMCKVHLMMRIVPRVLRCKTVVQLLYSLGSLTRVTSGLKSRLLASFTWHNSLIRCD